MFFFQLPLISEALYSADNFMKIDTLWHEWSPVRTWHLSLFLSLFLSLSLSLSLSFSPSLCLSLSPRSADGSLPCRAQHWIAPVHVRAAWKAAFSQPGVLTAAMTYYRQIAAVRAQHTARTPAAGA
jgi:hypothetical protein